MKRSYVVLGLLLGLFSVALPADDVIAKTALPSDEIQVTEVNEVSSENAMPVGGWSPMVGYKAEKDVEVEKPSVVRSRNIFNSPSDNVFSKGAGSVGFNALSKPNQITFYSEINTASINFMNASEDLPATQMLTESGIESVYVVAQLNYSDLGLNLDEALQAFCAYDYDHPGYYWISNSYWWTGTSIYLCTEAEYAYVSNRNSINNKIINGVKEYASLAEKVDDTYDKIALIHDRIITDVDYAYKDDSTSPEPSKWAHSVQGVFDSDYSKAVCEGYTDAFSLIMNYLDIPNYYIVGTAGDGGGHTWNAVSYDGGSTYMYMDLTWDDIGGDKGFFNKYFGMPSSDFESTHHAYTTSGTGIHWLYDLTGNFYDDFENSYYYKAGFYCSKDDNYKEFATSIRTKAHRFGTTFSYMSDDQNVLASVAREFNLGGYSYYKTTYHEKTYYIVIITKDPDMDLSGAEIILKEENYAYTGKEIKPEVEKVILNGIILIKDINYTVLYDNNIDSGDNTANVIVNGNGHFVGECRKAFSIDGSVLNDGNVSLSNTEFIYDGSVKKPEITVVCGNRTLIENENYTVEYSDNVIDAGTVTVTVKGIGEYRGTVEKNYIINPKPVKITALDQTVYLNEYIDQSVSKAVLVGALENHELTSISFSSDETDIITDRGTITPYQAVIQNGDEDVTANYDIIYISGKLSVVSKEYLITYTWSDDGKECVAKAVSSDEVIEENANVSGEVTKEATCKDMGTTTYTAKFENELFEIKTKDVCDIPRLTMHTPSEKGRENEQAATCESGGSYDEVVYCSVCDEEISRKTITTDALGHDYQKVTGSEKPATCTDDGKEADQKCSRCDSVMTGKVIEATGHNYGEWEIIKQPTETEEGEKTRTCKNDSSHTETQIIEKIKPDPIAYTVTVSGDGNGNASADPASGETGIKVTLSAIPNDGYQFKEWKVVSGDVTVAEITDNKFTIGNENVVIKAIFEKISESSETETGTTPATGGTTPATGGTTPTTGDTTPATGSTTPTTGSTTPATGGTTPATGSTTPTTGGTTPTTGDTTDPSIGGKTPATEEKQGSTNSSVEEAKIVGSVEDKKTKATYIITSKETNNLTVTYVSPTNKSTATMTVPDSVTINGKKYKVTEIKANAFKNNKKLKKITIGKNIKKIGKNAFSGCKNLKTVTIKTTRLTKKTVGSNAFKGINANAKVKVPNSKLKSYKTILKARGIKGKKQKITK